MKQHGRKSAEAQMAVANVEPIPRAAPPGELTDYEAAIWSSVVNTKPADWFQADTLPLLKSYCKHVSTAATIDQQIENFDPEWLTTDEGLNRFRILADMREKQSRALTALARSMRLTQQSKYCEKTANTAAKKVAKSRPWEM